MQKRHAAPTRTVFRIFFLMCFIFCVFFVSRGFNGLAGSGCARTGFEGGDRAVIPAAEVGKALRALGDDRADSASQGLVGSVPERVKLEVGRISLVTSCEFLHPLLEQRQSALPDSSHVVV